MKDVDRMVNDMYRSKKYLTTANLPYFYKSEISSMIEY